MKIVHRVEDRDPENCSSRDTPMRIIKEKYINYFMLYLFNGLIQSVEHIIALK